MIRAMMPSLGPSLVHKVMTFPICTNVARLTPRMSREKLLCSEAGIKMLKWSSDIHSESLFAQNKPIHVDIKADSLSHFQAMGNKRSAI